MNAPTKLPPGPKGKWLPTLALIRNPRRAFEKWVGLYGDPFFMTALNGPIVVTGRPELIRLVYGEDPSMFGTFAAGTLIPVLGAGSLLQLSGEPHKRERKLVMPMFHGERMRAYGTAMQQIARVEIGKRVTGQVVETLPMMTDISLDVIVRNVFSCDEDGLAEMRQAARNVVENSSPLIFFSKRTHIRLMGLSPWDRFLKAKRELYAAFDQQLRIAVQRQDHGEDILSMMATARYEDGSSISHDHLRDELMTFLFAGHETSALAMTWAVYHLHKNPDVLNRLRQEIDAVPSDEPDRLAAIPYLKAVVQESLRLHPIVTEVLRILVKPMHFGGYDLPAGITIAPAAALAHYNPEIYPDPDAFRPERFIERSFSPFEFMPFGGGHRRCVGAAFAMYEMAIVLGTLLKEFSVELLETQPVVPKRRSVTLGPSTGVRVRISKR